LAGSPSGDFPPSRQLSLGEEDLDEKKYTPREKETVNSYQRRISGEPKAEDEDTTGLRFEASVPVKTILMPVPEVAGLEEGKDYEVISEKITHRLAQNPASYVVLRYVRKVVKLKEHGEIVCAPAPASVIEKSYADVSFIAGLLIDKFIYHLPLYRQHQRLLHAGITLSRQTLTNLVHRAADLLEPVYYAQLSSILSSKVLAMDETPIKAGRREKGKMRLSYFWPLYGDRDEVAFSFAPTRATSMVHDTLGRFCGVLLSDGYGAYARYARKESEVVHAQCWAHTRRNFVEAEDDEPALVEKALGMIRKLYFIEEEIKGSESEDRLMIRRERSLPIVHEFFAWLKECARAMTFSPNNPFQKALDYALNREAALSVFLSEPDVQIDTNHLERALRPIPMGRKNWLFCWTECGAHVVGRIQSLLVTCKIHGVDPYSYLVDVLQRIDTHRVSDVDQLTPRLWKAHFGDSPLKSDLSNIDKDVQD
jgi:transposase